MTKRDARLRALAGVESWATCEHKGSTSTHHSCPTCGGTLRRCCNSLVGMYQHLDDCPELERRAKEAS